MKNNIYKYTMNNKKYCKKVTNMKYFRILIIKIYFNL